MIDITNIVPGGVICLASALSYYGLTTYEPLSTEIAVKNKRKIVLPENPPIHLYYFTKTRYETGISITKIDDIEINEVENKWIEIGNADVQYHIVGMDPEEFPENPQVDEIELFEMESSFLKKMIEKSAMISGATDDKRAHITGVLFVELHHLLFKI